MGFSSPVLSIGDLRWERVGSSDLLGGYATAFAGRIGALGLGSELAVSIGKDRAGERAVSELESRGIGTGLLQQDTALPTSSATIEISAGGLPVYAGLVEGAAGQLAPTPKFLDRADSVEVLYFNSYIQTFSVSGATLQTFLGKSPPSFKIYDVRALGRAPSREELEVGLQVASVVHICADDLPQICEVLGLPALEPELLCPLFPERYGVSYCVVSSPAYGACVASIVGEQVSVRSQQQKFIDLLGWNEAFLAGFVYHNLNGSSLARCCTAGMQYADLTAMVPGALGHIAPSDLDVIKGS